MKNLGKRCKPWLAIAGAMLLAACGSKPPAPAWKVNAEAALSAAENAYLEGEQRVFQHELRKTREHISRTGDPQLVARLELRQCALQVASLDWQPCQAFEPLRGAAGDAERAYADYLYGSIAAPRIALLPTAQRGVASAGSAAQALQSLPGADEPLSRLLAAAVALRRSGQPSLPLLEAAIDTASQQGWRRPLLAWLQLQQRHAQEQGDRALLERTRLRIGLIERGGQTGPDGQVPAPPSE